MSENVGGENSATPEEPTRPNPEVANPTERIEPLSNPTTPINQWQDQAAQSADDAAGQGTEPGQNQEPAAPGQPASYQAPGAAPEYPAETPQQPKYGQYAPSYPPAPGEQTPAAPAGPQHAAQYPSATAYPHVLSPAVRAEPKKRRKVGMGLFAASVIAAALIGGGVAGGGVALWGSQNSASPASSQTSSSTLIVNNKDNVNAVTAAAAKAMPSVVTISATSGSSGGTGSGIILNTSGDILTNTHVVTLDGAAANATIEVQLSNGKVYPGTIVGTDPLSDLAIVKISAPGLVPATLGDSSTLNVGDNVVAIGAPLGLSGTVTDGIVSTLNRTIQVASSAVPSTPSDSSSQGGSGSGGNGFQFSPPDGSSGSSQTATGTVNLNVIQTDAAINPGNSGGALVNSAGQVIGVNVAIASASSSSSSSSTQSGNIGVGFSIPINNAKRIAQELIATGKATHGQLGVSVQDATAGGANSGFTVGAQIAAVTSGSPAGKAGLKAGDVITEVGSLPVSDASSLTAAIRLQAGGSTVKVTFTRDGKQQSADVTLGTATN